jgi:hypothetical protein
LAGDDGAGDLLATSASKMAITELTEWPSVGNYPSFLLH